MARIGVNVLVSGSHMDRIMEVAAGLQAAGMEVKDVLDAVGVISGVCESGQTKDLCQIDGVADVEQTQSFQLPPPGSKIQ